MRWGGVQTEGPKISGPNLGRDPEGVPGLLFDALGAPFQPSCFSNVFARARLVSTSPAPCSRPSTACVANKTQGSKHMSQGFSLNTEHPVPCVSGGLQQFTPTLRASVIEDSDEPNREQFCFRPLVLLSNKHISQPFLKWISHKLGGKELMVGRMWPLANRTWPARSPGTEQRKC